MKGEGHTDKTRKEKDMASKASLENELRSTMLNNIIKMINNEYDTDGLAVSANEIAVPVVDSEDNEKFVLIKVSIPRGTRDGNGSYIPYDGYAAHDAYVEEIASKTQERAVKKAMKEAEKNRKKEE